MNKGGFSWKRAVGVTRAKSRISRKTGIPLSKSGRQRKVGRAVTGGGCLVPLLTIALLVVAACGAVASTPLPTDRPHRYGTMRVVDTLVRPSKGIGHQVVALLV